MFADADEAIVDEKESVFADQFHLGDRGNRLIARHLFGKLKPVLAEIIRREGK